MNIDTLLARLDRACETGPDRYVGRCPAHDDKTPSLAIRNCADGRILLHCFAGCNVESVVEALRLSLADLMPARLPGHSYKPVRQRFDARAALACVFHEALVVSIFAEDMATGKALDDADRERLTLAASRLSDAMNAATPLRSVRR